MSAIVVLAFWVMFIPPVTICVYYALPWAFNRFGRNIHTVSHNATRDALFLDRFNKIPIPLKWKDYLQTRISEAGIGNQHTYVYWIGFSFILPFVVFIIQTIQNQTIPVKAAVFLLCIILPNLILNNKIEKRKRAFIINAYKLYYFLHSQISAGIKVTDAIKGLYEIADHPLIQKPFIQFVAQYELTLNIEESLQVLRKSFSGYDCEMLCVSIQQCVNTGMAGKTLLKMEQMMFSKYFNYLQKDTEKFKSRLVISGVFAIVPLVMIFLSPVLFEAVNSFQTILETY